MVELEDLNPYLSIPEVGEETREVFLKDMTDAIERTLNK